MGQQPFRKKQKGVTGMVTPFLVLVAVRYSSRMRAALDLFYRILPNLFPQLRQIL